MASWKKILKNRVATFILGAGLSYFILVEIGITTLGFVISLMVLALILLIIRGI